VSADHAAAWWEVDGVGSLEIASVRERYAAGELTPDVVIAAVYDRIEAYGDRATFISLLSRDQAIDAANALGAWNAELPLWGIPCAIKDNIDAAGFDTTIACPEASYVPESDAPAVAALRAAGAIIVGKTNLDQFATGLNGTRSPYGVPRSPWREDLIPGGSSSGSGVAVAAGLVSFALGTDTAGSGRVPAAMGGIVGLKPSRGLVSARGVYPACASLDCVSVFALTVADASAVAAVIAGEDELDPFSRELSLPPATPAPMPPAGVRLAVPDSDSLDFFGDTDFREAWLTVLDALRGAGVTLVPVSLEDFFAAGAMLYGGAWLAERHAALKPMLDRAPQAVEPTVREIVSRGADVTAGEVFSSLQDLRALQRSARRTLSEVDALLTPTVSGVFTVQQMLADPIEANQRLGRFTTFTNLLDLCAIALPMAVVDGVPFGVTVQALAGSDARLAELATSVEELFAVPLGRPGWERAATVPPEPELEPACVELAVVGAHLRGQPLHAQLVKCGGEFLRTARTTDAYRLYALDTEPPKPGLIRTAGPGIGQEVELYAMPYEGLGRFLAAIPAPLGLGTVALDGGGESIGFLCEAVAVADALDISEHGGWRAYLESQSGR
jgi:allophanate hydrolase